MSRAIAAASGPPPIVEPHSMVLELADDRRAVIMVPLDVTDIEVMTIASFFLREGRLSIAASKAKASLGLIAVTRPPLVPV